MDDIAKEGFQAPDFCLKDMHGTEYCLSQFRGKRVVLYFYPKDNTPGCTQQACSFRDMQPSFSEIDTVIIGISKDSAESHRNFADKYRLSFLLLSDIDLEVAKKFGVFKMKKMFGKAFPGVQRTTFIIDRNGIVEKIIKKVTVENHAETVLQAIQREIS